MIVSGVKYMLKMCVYNYSSSENHIYFIIILILYILPRRNTFYELITKVANKFIEHRSLECALVNMLVLLSKYRDELQLQHSCVSIDNNFKRIFTKPKAIYQGEFNRYIYPDTDDTDDTDSEFKIENFNEYYQTLALSKEEQLDHLKRKIKMKLCDDCLMPYKD